MESKARILGHSLHQILIVFPLGLTTSSIGFDIMGYVTRDGRWCSVAYYLIIAGCIGGVVAAVAGLIDYWAIPAGTRAKRVAQFHGISSFLALLCFAMSGFARAADPAHVHLNALALSLFGGAIIGLAGWLGGELVTRMGVGVADDAHLDAEGTRLFGHGPDRAPDHVIPRNPAKSTR